MIKNKLYTALICLFCATSFAQQLDYIPLKSTGDLPEDFRNLVQNKISDQKKSEIDRNDSYNTKKSKKEFLLKSNYMLYNILSSGYVLYNEEVSNYVSAVLDNLISDSELKDEIRVYVIKSSEVNAFATNQGIIFVTTGLVAQLENEAQLAYILGHEITHYQRKHTINQYIESDRSFSNRGKYRSKDYDKFITKMSNYSKSLELESDSVSFQIMNDSPYDLKASLSVFDVLQFSYLPFDEIDFPMELFETENFKLPKHLYLDTINEINFDDDYDDSKSSHPNIRKRKSAMQRMLDEVDYQEGKTYIQDQNLFNEIQRKCRDEILRLMLRNGYYIEALYNARVMNLKDPQNSYYKSTMAKALYGIAKYQNVNKFNKTSPRKIEGSLSRYYHFFHEIERLEMNLVGLNAIMNINKELEDPFLEKLTDNLALDLMTVHEFVIEDLRFIPFVPEKVDLDSLTSTEELEKVPEKQEKMEDDEDEDEYVSKYDKIRKLREDSEDEEEESLEEKEEEKFHLHAFVDSDEEEIISLLQEAEKIYNEYLADEERAEAEYEALSNSEKRMLARDNAKEYRLNGQKLGVEKIVFIDPEFYAVDDREGVKLINSEEKQVNFVNSIQNVAAKSSLEVEVLSPKLFDENSTEQLNDMGQINSWMSEVLSHEDANMKNEFISFESEYLDNIIEKYGTTNFSYTGVITLKERKDNVAQTLLYTIVIYPLLPLGIVYAVTPKNTSVYYNVVFDAETSEVIHYDLTELKIRMNQGNINSLMYDRLTQFKEEKDEK